MNEKARNTLIARLKDSKSLMDILLQFEGFLNDLDLYAYKNWALGEIIEGPIVKRYWVTVKLKYLYEKMPDPDGGLRLVKHGAKISYQKTTENVPVPLENSSDYEPGTYKARMIDVPIWIVEIRIPRRFIDELDDSDLELYADEVDVEDISDARDQGIDGSTDLKTDVPMDGEEENGPA